ncbi:MAG: hypothetical protein KC613_23625 [Myxococcales bacterium]|nr:hypothetical protein [Myxococcales bacterium]MCB9522324.1 hypothetical protein [Myxococcales bacterium]
MSPWLALLPGLCLGTPAPPLPYTGAFRALEAHALTRPDSLTDVTVGLEARAATVLSLVDLDLGWAWVDVGPARVHQATAGARLHPFALWLLHGPAWADLLASVYVRAAVGPRFGADVGGVWVLGAGFDWPLGEPDHGAGLWIGPRYRHMLPFGPVSGVEGATQATVGLALSYRLNGL